MRPLRLLLAPLTALLLAAAVSCADAGPRTAPGQAVTQTAEPRTPDAPLVATRWTVDSLVRQEASSPLPAGVEGRAWFTLAADGSATGGLGCNRFNAKATVQGPLLTFGPLATTRMACEGPAGEVERELAGLFSGGPLAVEIKGDALTLTATTDGEIKGITARAASAVE